MAHFLPMSCSVLASVRHVIFVMVLSGECLTHLVLLLESCEDVPLQLIVWRVLGMHRFACGISRVGGVPLIFRHL